MLFIISNNFTRRLLPLILFLFFISFSYAQLSVPFEPRLPGGNIKVKGDLVYVANNIVGQKSDPNADYNGSASNQDVTMGYVNIDGDPSTFSSSSAELNAPNCSAVVYAGLYWGGIYPYNSSSDSNRDQPYKSVKFKTPGGSYIDISPSSDPAFEYETIYDKDGDRDGDGNPDPGVVDVDYLSGQNMTSYLNYANVTNLLKDLPDPNGVYTVANVVATLDKTNVASGWVMVVIYENANSTSKYISTFDGYAAMGSTYKSVEFPFSGFKTVPAPLPVNAVIGAAAIDGDRITGPSMKFRATPSSSWTSLSNSINPANNVFNSTISHLGNWVDTRIPKSHNTLGWDADILKLTNPGNSVLPNNHESGEIQISTSSEGVIVFLTTVSVEIIDPEILLEKKVEDLAGNDITGDGVNLGQSLEYVLRFWNRGNDDANNYSIRDVLPDNVSLENIDLSKAPGTVMIATPGNPRELNFTVPDNLVTQDGNTYEIRIQVKVSDNCYDFVEACSGTIDNIAYSTYQGATSNQIISDDPSVSDVNNCGIATVGVTNFLLDDLTNCSFEKETQLCGDNVSISAGDGYDTYTWYKDLNENGEIDAADSVFNDSDPDNNPATIVVQEVGTYLVLKESASCGDNMEKTVVVRYGSTQINPIITYINELNADADSSNDIQGEITTCPNDGSQLPNLFLCGAGSSQNIILNITDAQSITWEKIVEGSCSDYNVDCANTQSSCTWSQVATGNNYTVADEGQYRLVLTYSGGCSNRFYFNVFQNNLDFTYSKTDIFCSSNGNITINNVGPSYGFQLINTTTEAVVIPYAASNGSSFDIVTAGTYRVDFTALDSSTGEPIVGSCVFSTPELGIKNEQLILDLSTTSSNCFENGSIRIKAQDARANYYYELYANDGADGPGTFIDDEVAQTSNDFTFTNVNPGDYVVVVKTDDGCEVIEAITVTKIPDPVVSAVTTRNIGCTDGSVTLTGSNGFPDPEYLFAVWSKNGSTSYADPADIPVEEFQRDSITSGVFTFTSGEQGNYRFVIVDGNNCWSLSNEVTVTDYGVLVINTPTINTPIKCNDSSTGQLTLNASGGITPYSYSIDNGASFQTSPTFYNLGSETYDLVIRDNSGCEENLSYTLDNPAVFTAFGGVSSNATCDLNQYSEVRFTNVEGGVAPYEFSFDGGSSFIADDVSNPSVRTSLLPYGSHILIARDALGCEVAIPLTIDAPPPLPVFSLDNTYNCDGSGNVTVTADQTIYDYTYTIDTSPSASVTDGVFTIATPGSYTITATYTENNPPNPSVLLLEDFGTGGTVSSPYTQGYYFEDQVGGDKAVNDFDYTITNYLVYLFGGWMRPTDHTSLGADSNGRFLVINVGSPAVGQVIYKKPIKDIIPNQNMRISVAAFNLLKSGSQLNPDLFLQMRIPGTETVVGEVRTNDIPKNQIWNVYEFNMNPGTNTELEFVIISKKIGNSGNDVAIDDILVEQTPKSCERTQYIPIVVEDGKAFESAITAYTNITCNGANDGSITFEVENFDATAGFEYSIDGGTNWIASTTSPVTTTSTLLPGSRSILVRKADETSCSLTLIQTLTEPAAISVTGSIVQNPSCNDPSGTIKATVTGGSPTYEYALEDGSGSTLVNFPNPNGDTFTGLSAGDYVILVRDLYNCAVSSTIVTINDPTLLTYTADPSPCYNGANNASVEITANTGNGGYLFQIDNGPWLAPTPSTSNTYAFTGLANGSYDINVKDAYGCDGGVTTITIAAQIAVNISKTDVSNCADGSINVAATGGTGTLVYAFVPANTVPNTGDFATTMSFTIDNATALANPSGFDVYVRDNSGNTPFCEVINEDLIINPAIEWEIVATHIDPNCNGENGSIEITVQKNGGGSLSTSEISQVGPFTYELEQGGSVLYTTSNLAAVVYVFNNVAAGTYDINITDGLGCPITEGSITVTDPPVLTADVETKFSTGTCTPAEGFFFKDYPTSGLNGTVQFSSDNGTNWQTSNEFFPSGLSSGDGVYPSIRTIDGSGNTLCRYDLPRYTLSYPLDDLDITISALVIACTNLQVKVQGSEGTAPYTYAYTEDPTSFDPATATWTSPAKGLNDPYEFLGLIPGRTYVFYVQDANFCVRQSTINVNDIPGVNLPIAIEAAVKPSCFGGSPNGEINFTITPDNPSPKMRWELYELGNASPLQVSGPGPLAGIVPFTNTLNFTGLAEGDYFIELIQVDASNADSCEGASENILVKQQLEISANVISAREIGCNMPGLIDIDNINGGTGPYNFTVSGPSGFTTINNTTQNPIEISAGSPAGDYYVTVNDIYGCSGTSPYTVNMTDTPNPTIDAVMVTNCASSIEVNVTASSAVANLRYAMVTAGNTAPTNYLNNGGMFTNVIAGDYDIYIIDGNGCTALQTSFTVNPSLKVSAQLTKLLDCSGSPNAEITIIGLEGSGTYSYSITETTTSTNLLPKIPMSGTTEVYQASVAGTYEVTVYVDATATHETCTRTFTVVVPDAIAPIFTATGEDTNCYDSQDGTITMLQTDNGISPLTYELLDTSLNPIPTSDYDHSTPHIFKGLTIGDYIVRATGANSCPTNSSTITIGRPAEIIVPTPLAVVQFSCAVGNNGNNASITIDPSTINGGSATYVRYQFLDPSSAIVQDGNQTKLIITNYAGGSYTINVFDDNGCSGSVTVAIAPFDVLQSASINVDDTLSCANGGERITITTQGSLSDSSTGPHNYSFEQVGTANVNTTGIFTGLQVGIHSFKVVNTVTSCAITVTHTVEELEQVRISVINDIPIICAGDSGENHIEISGYNGNFTWEAFNNNGTPTNSADDIPAGTGNGTVGSSSVGSLNLAKGTYRILISETDFPYCPEETTITIGGPSVTLNATIIEIGNASCANDQGSLSIIPTGGIAPYTIAITSLGLLQTNVYSYVFSGLQDGTYAITITDAAGCAVTLPGSIQEVQPIVATSNPTTQTLNCIGDTNGSISTTLTSGGTGTLQYRINSIEGGVIVTTSASQNSPNFNNLNKGVYSITISDDANCTFTTSSVEILDPVALIASLVRTRALSCMNDAEIVLSAIGGTPTGGIYQWSTSINGVFINMDSGDNNTFTVPAGSYEYYVRDGNGCTAVLSNTISETAIVPLTVTIDQTAAVINCNGESTATIKAKASGGLGNYSYVLYTDAAMTTMAAPANFNGIFNNLVAGTYFALVESGDCQTSAVPITITEPAPLVVTEEVTNVSCNGEENGSITITMSGGTPDYQYAISPNLNKFDTNNTFTDLAPGEYTVIAQDAKGCFETISFTITEPEVLSITTTIEDEICYGNEDGLITIEIMGGTGPYSTSLNTNADYEEGRFTYSNLAAGNHVIFVKDTNGCIQNQVVEVRSGVNLNGTVTAVYECSGLLPTNTIAIAMEDETIRPDLLYSLDSTDPNDMVLNPDFTNLTPGQHTLTIAHTSGCTRSFNFDVENIESLSLLLSNTTINTITTAVTGGKPDYTYEINGQEVSNDNNYLIKRTDTYSVTVTDQNGCSVTEDIYVEFIDIEIPNFFSPDGDGINDLWKPKNVEIFPNIYMTIFDRYGREVYLMKQNTIGWGGFYKETNLPVGDYWYIIKLNGEEDTREFVGHFSLYR
tara:strand:+ start:40813 stop:51588 length:10776 start_codon:yes stop_codon:yes gene_type:complete